MNKKAMSLAVILAIIITLSSGCGRKPQTPPSDTPASETITLKETDTAATTAETTSATTTTEAMTTTAATTAETTAPAETSKAITTIAFNPFQNDISSLGLIIDYKEFIDPSLYEGRIPIKYGEGSETVLIIPHNQTAPHIKLYKTYLDEKTIRVEDIVFEAYHLPDEYYIEYLTYIPDAYPAEAVFIGDSRYRLAYDGAYSGGARIIKADVDVTGIETYSHWFDQEEYDKLSDYLSGIPLSNNAELVLIDDDEYYKNVSVKYPDNPELIDLFLFRSGSYFDISPDKTRIASIEGPGQDDFLEPFYVFDIPSKRKTLITEFDKPGENLASKDLLWLDDEILLLIAGPAYGTMTQGGNIYYFNPETGEKAEIVKTAKTGDSSTEISDIKLSGDYLEIEVCVIFNYSNDYFYYNDRIPISQVYELIRNNQTFEYMGMTIDAPEH